MATLQLWLFLHIDSIVLQSSLLVWSWNESSRLNSVDSLTDNNYFRDHDFKNSITNTYKPFTMYFTSLLPRLNWPKITNKMGWGKDSWLNLLLGLRMCIDNAIIFLFCQMVMKHYMNKISFNFIKDIFDSLHDWWK